MDQEAKSESKPKLRFPEFQNSPEWEERKLGDFANLVDERAGKNEYTPMSVTAGVGLVTQVEKFGKVIAGKSYKNYYVIKDGDFAYNKSATKLCPEGYITMFQGTSSVAVPNSIFTCFRVEDDNVNLHFLNHIFSANFHGAWLRRFITIGARTHGTLNVKSDDLLRMPIRIPVPNEQKKVADCLSFLDELIGAQRKKIDALKEYKNGLQQQLFPTEGETLPKLRFTEFRDAPEWEESMLGKVLTEHKLKSDGTSEVYSVSVHKGIVNQLEHLGRKYSAADTSKYSLVKPYDIVYTKSPTGDFPLGIVKQNLNNHNVIISPLYGVFSPINKYLGYIIHAYFESPARTTNFLEPIVNKGAKNTILISNETFLSKGIFLPSDEREQKKIADCLSSIDDLIAVQSEKLDALNAHKKGLMQQLFPSLDEVHG